MTCPASITVRGRSAESRATCEQDEGHEGMHEARVDVLPYETVAWSGGQLVHATARGRERAGMTWEGLNPPYSTIVADPPWDHSDGTGKGYGVTNPRRLQVTKLPYTSMSLEAITALPVSELAACDAHLYLWTTNRYLRAAYDVAEAWGFTVSKPLVWCKEPKGFFGPPFVSSAEFILYAKRGFLPALTRVDRQWWCWARRGHSIKPSAFLDIVETVSPGPYVELFARAPRLGWDSWGKGYESELAS